MGGTATFPPVSGEPGLIAQVDLIQQRVTLAAHLSDGSLELTWLHLGSIVNHYEVYRSLAPNFTPGAPDWRSGLTFHHPRQETRLLH